MNLDQTRAYLESIERSAAKLAKPPACPRCNSCRTMQLWPDHFKCAKCGHRFEQLALFPLPVASPVSLVLTPSQGPAPVQRLLDLGVDLETDL